MVGLELVCTNLSNTKEKKKKTPKEQKIFEVTSL
jgi:hypothetical protein